MEQNLKKEIKNLVKTIQDERNINYEEIFFDFNRSIQNKQLKEGRSLNIVLYNNQEEERKIKRLLRAFLENNKMSQKIAGQLKNTILYCIKFIEESNVLNGRTINNMNDFKDRSFFVFCTNLVDVMTVIKKYDLNSIRAIKKTNTRNENRYGILIEALSITPYGPDFIKIIAWLIFIYRPDIYTDLLIEGLDFELYEKKCYDLLTGIFPDVSINNNDFENAFISVNNNNDKFSLYLKNAFALTENFREKYPSKIYMIDVTNLNEIKQKLEYIKFNNENLLKIFSQFLNNYREKICNGDIKECVDIMSRLTPGLINIDNIYNRMKSYIRKSGKISLENKLKYDNDEVALFKDTRILFILGDLQFFRNPIILKQQQQKFDVELDIIKLLEKKIKNFNINVFDEREWVIKCLYLFFIILDENSLGSDNNFILHIFFPGDFINIINVDNLKREIIVLKNKIRTLFNNCVIKLNGMVSYYNYTNIIIYLINDFWVMVDDYIV